MVSLMNKVIKLQVWDSVAAANAGRPRELPLDHSIILSKVACPLLSSVGAVLVYDVTKRMSFDGVRSWLNDTREYGNDNMILILVGNKADLIQQ
jgi:hypothetical protein